ncbi:MAG: Fur family transcriptional regulator [Actinomycetota bacterium]
MSTEAPMLEQADLRPTKQRLAIIEAIEKSGRLVTAQALHAKLNKKGADGPGLATVYRTLQALADAGLVRTFPAGEGELAYKLCDPVHHHHLICENCGRVAEIPSCEVEDWASAVARKRGFQVSSHQAEIYGLCERCSKG